MGIRRAISNQRGYMLLLVPVVLVGISVLVMRAANRSKATIRVAGAELNYIQTGMCAQQCAGIAVNSAEKKLNDNAALVDHSEDCACNPVNAEDIDCRTDFTSILDTGITNCYGSVMNRTTMDITVACKKTLEDAQTIQENVGFSEIPIFQFAVFFEKTLDIAPGDPMSITGRVHSNDSVLLGPNGHAPSEDLSIHDWITSPVVVAGKKGSSTADIGFPRVDGGAPDKLDFSNTAYKPLHELIPGWSSWQKSHRVAYADKAGACGKVVRLAVPLRDSANTHALIDWRDTPAADQSDLRNQKFAWRADLLYKSGWRNNNMGAASLGSDPLQYPLPAPWGANVTLTADAPRRAVFWDYQQGVQVKLLPVNLARLRQRAGDDVIYLFDEFKDAAQGNKDVGGFLLYNGAVQTRPLTIVSNTRVYMWGDFNTAASFDVGGGFLGPYPVAIVCDIFTQLSNVWRGNGPQKSAPGYERIRNVDPEEETTLNACVMGGMVVSGGAWIGGYQNFIHFIEDWSGIPHNFTGSAVALWGSKHPGTVSTAYYYPPNRNWAFHSMYRQMKNMPPATPRLVEPKLNAWQMARR